MNHTQDPLLNEIEAAELLKVSPRTLQGWRYRGDNGPEYYALGSVIRYSLSQIDSYLNSRTRRSTSGPGVTR